MNGVKVLFIVSVSIILSASVSGSIYNVISMLLVDIAHINTSSIELLVFMWAISKRKNWWLNNQVVKYDSGS